MEEAIVGDYALVKAWKVRLLTACAYVHVHCWASYASVSGGCVASPRTHDDDDARRHPFLQS